MYNELLANIAILVLSGFVRFAVISKVPNTLHTPLMSGTNAIHGIVVLGALVVHAPAGRASAPQQEKPGFASVRPPSVTRLHDL
ncbi:pyridine nucleotide transhydrogenase-like protein [Rhodococcus sp. SMB37]|uniref:proton-translocating transhydrogenase family protein n=1 Tax=Rhodococcus sp. SMB37 TaxID=2512213 RepID=UPI0010F17C15|nr:pyridine nucleotide transhydrogenase-like protein [Rhodococcus sp. SMB37]